jgi:hypothetical protein
VKGRGVEDGYGAVRGFDEQGDLRTAQDDALGPAALQLLDDRDVGPPRRLADLPEGELVVDDVVDGRPPGLFGDEDLEAVLR